MLKLLLYFLLVFPAISFAQLSITGKVVSHNDKMPIAAATVFLNNTTGGAITAEDGAFTLANVKQGHYQLVITCIGYQPFYQDVKINNAPLDLRTIELNAKITELHEVRIKAPDPNRARYLAMFLKEFFGSTANAAQCTLLNPKSVDLEYNRQKNTLSASSDEDLVIENETLGYKMYYLLNNFSKNYKTHLLFYDGPVRFEEMQGKASQHKRWAANRLKAYKGSGMHFLRSVYDGSFHDEGFTIYRMSRKPNPARPPDSLLKAKMRIFAFGTAGHPDWVDSMRYYSDKMRLPKTIDYVYSTSLDQKDFSIEEANDTKSLKYPDMLYVIYRDKLIRKPDNSQEPPSTLLILNAEKATFDRNGILIDPNSIINDGTWSKSGVADMLPVNYVPL